jgi:hypothetical protein
MIVPVFLVLANAVNVMGDSDGDAIVSDADEISIDVYRKRHGD